MHGDFHPKNREQRGENSHLCRNLTTMAKTQPSDQDECQQG